MNIKEIAEKAGVSIATVDRVLHNRGRVSRENIDKILKIAKENGYEPNSLASRLKSRDKLTFGVLIPFLDSEFGYWKQVYRGFEDARAELKGQQVELVFSFFNRNRPDTFLTAGFEMLERNVDAYIVAPLVPEGMKALASASSSIPYAFIDSSLPDFSPAFDLSQSPLAAGKVGARMMNLLSPNLDRVFTLSRYATAFNCTARSSSFASEFERLSGKAVTQLVAEDVFELFPLFNTLDRNRKHGLFVVNDGSCAASEALERAGLLDSFTIVGFDLSPENRNALLTGRVSSILGQRPISQAYDAVMLFYRRFALKIENEGRLSSPVDIYIRENVPETDFWL
jgi:Transcriptional regulators